MTRQGIFFLAPRNILHTLMTFQSKKIVKNILHLAKFPPPPAMQPKKTNSIFCTAHASLLFLNLHSFPTWTNLSTIYEILFSNCYLLVFNSENGSQNHGTGCDNLCQTVMHMQTRPLSLRWVLHIYIIAGNTMDHLCKTLTRYTPSASQILLRVHDTDF